MIKIAINPGTGPIADTHENHAVINMKHFITDVGVQCDCIRIPEKDYGDGRFAFLVWRENQCHEIQMPGLPLEKVRFMGNSGQDIWEFPRLYVDDSSWVWCYAINMLFETSEDAPPLP